MAEPVSCAFDSEEIGSSAIAQAIASRFFIFGCILISVKARSGQFARQASGGPIDQ